MTATESRFGRLGRYYFARSMESDPEPRHLSPGQRRALAILMVIAAVVAVALMVRRNPSDPSTAGKSRRTEPPRPPFNPTSFIVVAGTRVEIGTPVVLWSDPIGYDAYSTRCRTLNQELPVELASRPNASPLRYGQRDTTGLAPAAAEAAKRNGMTLDDLRARVHQFVLHYDAVGSSERCFRALHDNRGLSVHFMLDLDGTIYQTLDVRERAFHGAEANDRSVGVEIANIGAMSTPKLLEKWYSRGPDGNVLNLFPVDERLGIQRTIGYVARPARNELQKGLVQNSKFVQYDFTKAQYMALIRLSAGLCRSLPRIKAVVPRDQRGAVVTRTLPPAERARFEGILGHHHVSDQKYDPGPAFDWDLFLGGVTTLLGK